MGTYLKEKEVILIYRAFGPEVIIKGKRPLATIG